MAKVNLTGRHLKSQTPAPASGRISYQDAETEGLEVRVTAAGKRTFAVRYRSRGLRTSRRYTLGDHPPLTLKAARIAAEDLLAALRLKGEDPFDARAARERPAEALAGPTLAALATSFLEVRESKLADSTATEYRRIIKAYLKEGPLADRTAASLTAGDLEARLAAIAKDAPRMANRVYQLVHAVTRWGRKKGMLTADPMESVERPAPEQSRERVLKPAEIAAVWKAAEEPAPTKERVKVAHQVATLVRLLLLLGTRSTETILMRWQDLDLVGVKPSRTDKRGTPATWTIPGEYRKGERLIVVPLSPTAVKILEDLQPVTGEGERVFPDVSITNVERDWWSGVRDRAMAAGAQHFTRHDLRRTCATGCAELGAEPHIVSRILGHAMVEGTVPVSGAYNRYVYLHEKATALNAWAGRVLQAVATAGKGARVLAHKPR